ncbi:MAG: DUF222 domain-containing protein [Actinomycetia bacterium]|nr:DUF222 domain-containing protein [Actinomycetes bacterium]
MFFYSPTADELACRLREVEAEISDLRCEQATLVNELDKKHVAGRTGHRSMNEWLSAELDVSRSFASDLVFCARHLGNDRSLNARLGDGDVTFDRAVALMRLADAGADQTTLTHSETVDLPTVKRLIANQRRVTRRTAHEAFMERFVAVQATLDESSRRITGQLAGVDGDVLERALYARADELRLLAGGDGYTRGQLQADALVAMAHDSLNRTTNSETAPGGGSVSILVDLGEANGTGGENGCEVEYGPRAGPAVLEELLCTGTVQIIGLDNGTPVVTSKASRAIPPAVRRLVAHRDGGCTIAGCTSRYRLEPHHIQLRADGGSHDPENLTTLCWFHHHVAIHQQGLRIDPDSPPLKRRLIRPQPGHDPPGCE